VFRPTSCQPWQVGGSPANGIGRHHDSATRAAIRRRARVALPISRPAVSRHLRLLKDSGLVTESNPVGGWYGLRKGYRGRFAMYIPPLLEELGLVELEHNPRSNRLRGTPA
jgi:DNA-binding transcriptional ArsR family regulator